MANQLLTIAEAASVAKKSQQTIRRLIKNDNVKSRRKRTPQGFNYMVDKASLLEYLGVIETQPKPKKNEPAPVPEYDDEPEIYVLDPQDEDVIEEVFKVEDEITETLETTPEATSEDSPQYTAIIEKLLDQHQSDKEKLYSLVEAFQNRVVTLEEQIKLLQAPKKPWWKVW
ncbi:MAG: helix-turn-helix domain-containing protein [Patescibacteria group bacterium]|nr:helix-turn-helix domain-containing protein [Patescibacteria group bacterium]